MQSLFKSRKKRKVSKETKMVKSSDRKSKKRKVSKKTEMVKPLKMVKPFLLQVNEKFRPLAENGFQVIIDVINKSECSDSQEGILDWFQDLGTGLDRTGHNWTSKNSPVGIHKIFQNYKTGHLQALWNIRQNPKVVQVFADLWGVTPEELLTSFDAMSVKSPPELRNRKPSPNKSWIHFDQGPHKATDSPDGLNIKAHCVQGFVSLTNLNYDDDVLIVLKNSHKYHKKFFAQFPDRNKPDDWIKFNDDERKWLLSQPDVEEVRVACPAGSLILWDSRTAHSGSNALRGRKEANWCFKVYTSYMPRIFATPKEMKKKRMAFYNRRTCTHWALQSKLFPINPRFGFKMNELQHPHLSKFLYLTQLGYKLAGFQNVQDFIRFNREQLKK
jgi:hypothetical protein